MSEPVHPHMRRIIFLLAGIAAMGPLAIDMYLPALPAIQSNLAIPASVVQLTLTGFFVGMALGTVVVGPVADRFGRRLPMLWSLSGYVVVAILCATTRSAWSLITLRAVQGALASTFLVLESAMIRDIAQGREASRAYSLIMAISTMTPVVAPLVGSWLYAVAGWRSIFLAIAIWAVLWLAIVWASLPETLPVERRKARSGSGPTENAYSVLLRDRTFVAAAIAGGLSMAAFYAYLSASSLILQHGYGLSPTGFGLVFAGNSAALVLTAFLNRVLSRWETPARLLLFGLGLATLTSGAFLAFALAGIATLPFLLVFVFLTIGALSLAYPNILALGLNNHPAHAASGAAIIQVLQTGLGAIAAPLPGLGSSASALPLALVMFVAVFAGLGCFVGIFPGGLASILSQSANAE